MKGLTKSQKNILMVVEGAKREPALLNRAFQAFGLDGERHIVSLCANVHELLRVLRDEYQGDYRNVDLRLVLCERFPDYADKLDAEFTDVLLVFDFDPQDNRMSQTDLEQLQSVFCDSTDMGQLYINYPAVEAYRDFEDFDDVDFLDRAVSLRCCHNYKALVDERNNKLDNIISIDSLSFARVLAMHVSKLQHVLDGIAAEDTLYWTGLSCLSGAGADMEGRLSELLAFECQLLASREEVSVCCPCLLFVCAWPTKVDAVWTKALNAPRR